MSDNIEYDGLNGLTTFEGFGMNAFGFENSLDNIHNPFDDNVNPFDDAPSAKHRRTDDFGLGLGDMDFGLETDFGDFGTGLIGVEDATQGLELATHEELAQPSIPIHVQAPPTVVPEMTEVANTPAFSLANGVTKFSEMNAANIAAVTDAAETVRRYVNILLETSNVDVNAAAFQLCNFCATAMAGTIRVCAQTHALFYAELMARFEDSKEITVFKASSSGVPSAIYAADAKVIYLVKDTSVYAASGPLAEILDIFFAVAMTWPVVQEATSSGGPAMMVQIFCRFMMDALVPLQLLKENFGVTDSSFMLRPGFAMATITSIGDMMSIPLLSGSVYDEAALVPVIQSTDNSAELMLVCYEAVSAFPMAVQTSMALRLAGLVNESPLAMENEDDATLHETAREIRAAAGMYDQAMVGDSAYRKCFLWFYMARTITSKGKVSPSDNSLERTLTGAVHNHYRIVPAHMAMVVDHEDALALAKSTMDTRELAEMLAATRIVLHNNTAYRSADAAVFVIHGASQAMVRSQMDEIDIDVRKAMGQTEQELLLETRWYELSSAGPYVVISIRASMCEYVMTKLMAKAFLTRFKRGDLRYKVADTTARAVPTMSWSFQQALCPDMANSTVAAHTSATALLPILYTIGSSTLLKRMGAHLDMDQMFRNMTIILPLLSTELAFCPGTDPVTGFEKKRAPMNTATANYFALRNLQKAWDLAKIRGDAESVNLFNNLEKAVMNIVAWAVKPASNESITFTGGMARKVAHAITRALRDGSLVGNDYRVVARELLTRADGDDEDLQCCNPRNDVSRVILTLAELKDNVHFPAHFRAEMMFYIHADNSVSKSEGLYRASKRDKMATHATEDINTFAATSGFAVIPAPKAKKMQSNIRRGLCKISDLVPTTVNGGKRKCGRPSKRTRAALDNSRAGAPEYSNSPLLHLLKRLENKTQTAIGFDQVMMGFFLIIEARQCGTCTSKGYCAHGSEVTYTGEQVDVTSLVCTMVGDGGVFRAGSTFELRDRESSSQFHRFGAINFSYIDQELFH